MVAKSVLLNVFCENLRRFRKGKGVTQVDMAKRLGIRQGAYSSLERGVFAPTITTIEKVAQALDVSPTDLLLPQAKSISQSA